MDIIEDEDELENILMLVVVRWHSALQFDQESLKIDTLCITSAFSESLESALHVR